MRSAPTASPRQLPSGLARNSGRERPAERRLGPSQHRGPPPARQRARPGPVLGRTPRPASVRAPRGAGSAEDPDPARGLTPPHHPGRPRGTPESISMRGGARGQRPGRSSSDRKWEPPLPSRSWAQPSPIPAVPLSRWRAAPCLSRGGRTQRKSFTAAAAPLSWDEGSGGITPNRRRPELLLRSSGLTAAPGNQRRNCHSPPPAAPAFPAPSSHFFPLPPSPRPAPPRRSARVPCVMASRPPGPPRAPLGRSRSPAHVR